MRKKTLVILGVVAILTLTAGTLAWRWSRNVLVLENATDKTARVVTVTMCGMRYRVVNLPSGRTTQINFEVTGDSGFRVDATCSTPLPMPPEPHRAASRTFSCPDGLHRSRAQECST